MTERERILDEAKRIISSDRNVEYGEPERNFERISDLWSAYLGEDRVVYAHDVAVMLALVKVARIANSPNKEDHWVDLAGYAACGGELRPPEMG
jgi:hypothetical protein